MRAVEGEEHYGRDAIAAEAIGKPGSVHRRRIIPIALAAAAVFLFLVLTPAAPLVEEFQAGLWATRGVEEGVEIAVSVRVKRSCYIQIVFVDQEYVGWIKILSKSGDKSEYSIRIDETWDRRWSLPGMDRIIAVILVASEDQRPTSEQLNAALPHPLAKPEVNRSELVLLLDRFKSAMEDQFGCSVRIEWLEP